MTITRRSLADTIDELDEQIAELQDQKRETFDAYRTTLENRGVGKGDVKAEVAACKAAIKRRRQLRDDPDAVEARDALTAEVLSEIQRTGTPVATRTRATREQAPQLTSIHRAPAPAPSPAPDPGPLPDYLDRRKQREALQ